MKESEMERIAELLERAIADEEKLESVKNDVARLVTEFQKVEYCFDNRRGHFLATSQSMSPDNTI